MTALGMVAVNLITVIFPALVPAICGWKQETMAMISVAAFNVASLIKFLLDRRAVKAAKNALVWVGALMLVGCSSIPQKLNPDVRYRNDLPFCVEGYGCFEGVTVLPRLPQYKFEISPKGDANVDLLVVTTCNRNKSFERTDPGIFWGTLNYFGKIFGKKKEGFTYLYVPIPGKEDDGDCALMLQTYEKDKGRHAWSFIRFEHPKYQLPATLFCDGEIRPFNGVSICQGKTGLTQWVKFPEKVMIEPGITEKGQPCSVPKRDSTGDYAWKITNEECGYTIRGESGRLHDLTATGYTGEVIREIK